jgi:hypothetical protein
VARTTLPLTLRPNRTRLLQRATRATLRSPTALQYNAFPALERAARRAGGHGERAGGHGEKDTEERLGLKNLVGTGGSESLATSTFASPIR